MVTTRRVASAACAGLTLGALLLGLATAASARSTSDQPASILVYPKIVVSGTDQNGGTDTVLDISNVNDKLVAAHCWLINANSHCASDADRAGEPCGDSSECHNSAGNYDTACLAGWSEIDFEVKVTPNQPLAWSARDGLRGCFKRDPRDCGGLEAGEFPINEPGHCKGFPNISCNPSVPSSAGVCPSGVCEATDSNYGSAIPGVPEIPFVGALKCIQYSTARDVPDQDASTTNALIGHAAITTHGYAVEYSGEEVERYNAVGLRHIAPMPYDGVVRMDGVQYAKCPSTLVLDHFYDGAPVMDGPDMIRGGGTLTDLTLVPCGDDFLRQDPGDAVAQIITINEFEQRLSAAKKVDCFYESILSRIDTNRPERSIFNASVQGSFAGQTLIHGAGISPTGHGLLGVARLSAGRYYTVGGKPEPYDFSAYGAGAALNLQQKGSNGGIDLIVQPN